MKGRVNMQLRINRYSYLNPANPSEEMKKRNDAKQSSAQERDDEPSKKQDASIARSAKDYSEKYNLFKPSSQITKPDYNQQKPKNYASSLTHRLVGSRVQMEVRQIITKVNAEMIQLRFIAAGNDKNSKSAQMQIRQLQKLLDRANLKLRDLDREDGLKLERFRAERQKKKELSEKLKTQLRRQRMTRAARENGYLIEDMHEQLFGRPLDSDFGENFFSAMPLSAELMDFFALSDSAVMAETGAVDSSAAADVAIEATAEVSVTE